MIGSDGLELTVKLSKEELDEVAQKTSLCYTNATCVIHVGTDAVDDMAGNTMQSITRGISDFVGDSIAPTLVTFNFTNDGLGKVILEFSETMDQGSLNISASTLQDNSTSNVTYTLIGASNSDSDGTIFTISMNKTEADALKTLGICITQDVCFIVLDSTAMKDMSAFDVDAVVDGDARQATSVSPDVANPNFISSVEFDYNAETLTLSFDEPVIPSTLNASAVTLADDDEDVSVSVRLTNGSTASVVGSTIVFQFVDADLNQIKLEDGLCKKIRGTDCYVGLDATFITDVSGLSLTAGSSLKTRVVLDTTSPVVVSVSVDMQLETVTVVFDEPVENAKAKLSGITLTNAVNNPSASITLGARTEPQDSDVDSVEVVFGLPSSDVVKIKAEFALCTSASDCFAVVANTTAQDMEENINVAVTKAVFSHTADSSAPTFSGFTEANPSSGELKFSFSEPVQLSVNFSAISVQSSATNASGSPFLQYTLQQAPTVVYNPLDDTKTALIVTLAEADRSAIDLLAVAQSNPGIFTLRSNTFVVLGYDAFQDAANISLSSDNVGLQTDEFNSRVAVALVEFDLNMSSGQLDLSFSSAVSSSSLSGKEMTLRTGVGSGAGVTTLPLTGGSTTSTDGTKIQVDLSDDDLNAIKAVRTLAIANTSTFLSLTANTFVSVFDDPIAAVVADQAKQVTIFVEDSIAPVLNNFTLAIDPGYITLSFSEMVSMLKFDLLSRSFAVGDGETALNTYVLTGGTASASDSATSFNVTLTDTDLNAIKANPLIGVNESSTFAFITSGLIQDMNNNTVVAISNGSGLQAALVTGDISEPELISFNLDMNSSTATIGFSETVLASTLNATKLTLRQSNSVLGRRRRSSVGTPKQLTAGLAAQLDATTILLTITNGDLNDIKADTDMCTRAGNCFLSVDAGAIKDSSGNGVVATVDGAAIGVSNFTADSTKPELVSFDFNISSGYGTLVLSFSETVDGARFTADALVLQSVSSSSSVNRTLSSDATLAVVERAAVLVVELTKSDSDAVKNTLSLASDAGSTFLTLLTTAIVDTNNNSVVAVGASDALGVSNYTADVTAPQLTSFVLNLNANTMTLNFDEPVNVSSFDASNATLHASPDGLSGSSVVLTGGSSTVTTDGLKITLSMLDVDVNSLTGAIDLAVSNDTTFLSFDSGLVKDTAGNDVAPISSTASKEAASHIDDSSAASLSSFDLDMNGETLTLHFNETMNASSVEIADITLQVSSNSTADGQHQLSTSTVVTSSPSLSVVIGLALDDLNAMKLKQIGASENSSFLVMEQGTVKDMTGVATNAVVNGVSAAAVDVFVVDSTAPVLTSFDLDINSSTATLRFSEVVKTATFDATALLLQHSNTTTQTCPCAKCLDNEYLIVLMVRLQDSNCAVCQECEIGFYETASCTDTTNSNCTVCETCNAGSYLNAWCSATSATDCQDCADANCADCTGPGDACVECAAGTILHNGTCVTSCDAGMYNTTAMNGQVCMPCDPACETCTEANKCASCPAANTLVGTSCSTVCTGANAGKWHDTAGGACETCHHSCESCYGPISTNCQSCNSSLVLHNRRECLGSCPTGTYNNSGFCDVCPAVMHRAAAMLTPAQNCEGSMYSR